MATGSDAVRRPRVSQESTSQAGLSGGNDHVLACLLALNALRVSEACGADVADIAPLVAPCRDHGRAAAVVVVGGMGSLRPPKTHASTPGSDPSGNEADLIR